MAATLTTHNTLAGVFVPETDRAAIAKQIALIVLGTGILTIAAKVQVPYLPISYSLQSLAVALIAGAGGWRIGVATVALYILEGLLGLPVFTRGGGLAYILQPSFGFIAAWLPMAYVIGRAADAGASGRVVPLALVMLLADALTFVLGFLWLLAVSNIILGSGNPLPSWLDANNLLATAWNGAVQPFLVWDTVKMIFAAVTVAGAWGILKRRA
jgi:biotin transport system substrate-specific component